MVRFTIITVFQSLLLLSSQGIASSTTAPETYQLLGKLSEAFRLVREHSYPPISDKELLDGAIEGMLKKVDLRSALLSTEALEDVESALEGTFYGIGIYLTQTLEGPMIMDIQPGSPAARAGLKKGDSILAINREGVAHLSMREIKSRLNNPSRKDLSLTIKNGTAAPKTLTLESRKLFHNPMKIYIESNILILALQNLNQFNMGRKIRKTIQHYLDKGEEYPIEGVIIDLRDNYGGLVDEAVSIARLFLHDEVITQVQGQEKRDNYIYLANKTSILSHIPIVVLINEGTASAAEILAAALQDHGRALIIGMPSYGKASVQSILPLSRGLGALKLTTHHYLTPKNKDINLQGIEPDIHLSYASSEHPAPTLSDDPFIRAAKEYILSKKQDG